MRAFRGGGVGAVLCVDSSCHWLWVVTCRLSGVLRNQFISQERKLNLECHRPLKEHKRSSFTLICLIYVYPKFNPLKSIDFYTSFASVPSPIKSIVIDTNEFCESNVLWYFNLIFNTHFMQNMWIEFTGYVFHIHGKSVGEFEYFTWSFNSLYLVSRLS